MWYRLSHFSSSSQVIFYANSVSHFRRREKIVSCVMSTEKPEDNLSVPQLWCLCISSTRTRSEHRSIGAHRQISRSIHALVNDGFTCWSDITPAVYPSLSLSAQPASCTAPPAAHSGTTAHTLCRVRHKQKAKPLVRILKLKVSITIY